MSIPPNLLPADHAAAAEREERLEQHEMDVEQREAYEYWGYLFQKDKTGTDKLKRLLQGLKDEMNARYEPSDQPDLTPNQLAQFYRDMRGNYDQLFINTPAESLAFIYKSLGCLHSLQPLHNTHATAFTDPNIPALKTEGWIMWQTIQILLGPDEHAGFIREAVELWDIKDRESGELFPKILPRQCFPSKPDEHMVAWYEGVSERLKREAEDEERRKEITVEEEEESELGPRRLRGRPQARREGDLPSDDEESVDSRVPALAYFRDPLYRHVDGRPSIVRRESKRPNLSPRPTMMDKGKGAAATFGHIVRNVGSPHLWDGGRGGSRSGSRDRERERRRRSNPDPAHHHRRFSGAEPPTSAGSYESRPSPRDQPSRQHRQSSQVDRPSTAVSDQDEWEKDDDDPVYSPTGLEADKRRTSRRGSSDGRNQPLRHSRSHEPTPSQKEADDYFGGYDSIQPRRNSAYDPGTGNAQIGGGAGSGGLGGTTNVGPSFGPSASPLFASHVARQPQPPPPTLKYDNRPPSQQPYDDRPPPRNPSVRRAQGRYPSRSPHGGSRPPPGTDRRYDSPRRRYDGSPGRAPYPDYAPGSGPPPLGGGRHAPEYSGRPHPGMRYNEVTPPGSSRYAFDPHDRDREQDRYRDRDRDRDRRGGRMSGSDLGGYYSGDDGGRGSRPKQTRFADTGVGGRRYPEQSPWRRGS